MRLAAAIFACLVGTACAEPVDVRAPVNVAGRLFVGCVSAALMTYEPTKDYRERLKFAEALDDRCLAWMLVWYPVLMDKDDITRWPEEKLARFTAIREGALRAALTFQ